MYLKPPGVSACLTKFVPWNNPGGLHNADPKALHHNYQNSRDQERGRTKGGQKEQ